MALVIGHRGAKALAPENTLKGIKIAAKCGADLIEVDLRLSRDGILVLMHDETVDRTTDALGKVEDLSFEELKALNIEDQKIPSLEEAASLANELNLGLVVEMKEEGMEELVVGALKGRKAIVSSFYHASLREIKELSDLKTGIIISSLPLKPIDLALWANADAIFPKRFNPRLFKDAHRHNLKVYPWTINEKKEAAWLLRLGADGLVTDDPCAIREVADQPLKDTAESNCDYYPCHHFEGQDCTHCFCALYPCKDPELGKFVRTKAGKRVWTCIDCTLIHKAPVAKYLIEHPEATSEELKAIGKKEDV